MGEERGQLASLDGRTKGLAIALDERKAVTWAISAETGNAQRTPSARPAREIEQAEGASFNLDAVKAKIEAARAAMSK